MFSITRSRRRSAPTRIASPTQPGSQAVRQAFFDHLSDGAASKSFSRSSNIRTANAPGRTYYNPVYDDLTLDTLTSRFIPNDYRKQNELWRKIYIEDAVAGPSVDLYKDMPWSEFGLLGIKDPTILQFYEDCCEAIQLEAQLPFISLDFLVLGRFIPHFLFDSQKGYWSRMILHDPDYIKVSPIPIPGLPPKLDLVPTDAMKQFASSNDPRDIAAKQSLSQDLIAYLLRGQDIPLDPRNTSYIARRSSSNDSVGTSIYTRLLDIIAYQKGLMQGSQAAVRRRLGAVRTVTVGNEDWEPTVDEINEAAEALLAADEDPVGAVVGMRQGIEYGEAGGGSAQDILKISDEWQFITEAKMQALGINESFLSGDATYSTMETLLSVFLERIRAHRDFITKFFIQDKIFRPLAEINNFRKIPEKRLAHRYRMLGETTQEELLIPTVQYTKNLRPVADREYLDILEMAQERGLPVTLKTWATFAGFDLQDELERLPEDLALRRSLREYQAATDPDYADKLQNVMQESGLVVPLRMWANAVGLDVDELAEAMSDDVAMRRKFRQWSLQASPEMPDKIRDAIEQGVPVPIAEVSASYGLNLDKLLEVKDDDLELRVEIKKWLTAVSPEARDFLEMAQDKGIPVSLEVWAQTLGLDLETLRSGAPTDIELRKELTPWRNAAEGEFEGEEDEEGGDDFGLGGGDEEEEGGLGDLGGDEEEDLGGGEEAGLDGLEDIGEEPEELPEIPTDLPDEGEDAHVLEVDKEDIPELMEKIKEKHPKAKLPEDVKEDLAEEPEVTEEDKALQESEIPVPPEATKQPVRKLTPKQEKKLTKSIRDVLLDTLKNYKKATATSEVITKLYKNGYYSIADSLYRQGVMSTSDEVPVDLGYLLDGILPNDILPPQGYLKTDVLEYKTVTIDKSEWDNLVGHLNKQVHEQTSGSWGKSLAEFLRTKSPYPTHNNIAVTCVSRVRIFVTKKTKNIRIVPESVSEESEQYTFTYYHVNRLNRPNEIDPKKLLITDLERSFQAQFLLADIPKEEAKLPDVVPAGSPTVVVDTAPIINNQGIPPNILVSAEVEDQIIQILRSLPIWSRSNTFVNLKQKEAEYVVKKVIKSRGIGKHGNYSMHMGLFNPKKKQLAQYVLARLGLIEGITLESDVAADIVTHLTKHAKTAANPSQINELFMMATLKNGETPQTSSKTLQSRSKVRTPPIAAGDLLTGTLPKT